METFDSIEKTEFTNFLNANNNMNTNTVRTNVPMNDEIEANHILS